MDKQGTSLGWLWLVSQLLGIFVTVILIGLDGADVIDWKWKWILAPTWLPLVGLLMGIVISGIIAAFMHKE